MLKGKTADSNNKLSDNSKSAIFLSPAFLLLLIFFITPMFLTILFSFTNLALTGTQSQRLEFVGFDNFIRMANDLQMYDSIGKTFIFVIFSAIIGQSVLGFLIAYLMKEKNVMVRRFVGTVVITAWVTPEIVAAFTWVAYFAESGTLNSMLSVFNQYEPIAFLFQYPMVSVIVANIWRGTAFSMMAFQTSLDDIPDEIMEAAVMDGATSWQRLTRVILPMLKGTIATNLMLVTLQSLGVFTLIYTMTGGGPGNQTSTLPIYMYQQAFISSQLGYGTAISLVILLIGAIFSVIYTRILKADI